MGKKMTVAPKRCEECGKHITENEHSTEFGSYCEACYKACIVNTVDLKPDSGGQDGRAIDWDELI